MENFVLTRLPERGIYNVPNVHNSGVHGSLNLIKKEGGGGGGNSRHINDVETTRYPKGKTQDTHATYMVNCCK